MNLKKIQKALTTAILAIVLASGSVTAASAGTGGGTGGGGSTGQQNGFYWASVSSSSSGTAYNQFLSKARWSRAFTEGEVARRVGNLSVCQNSDVIWFLMGPSVWAYNFQGYPTWPTSPVISGTIENPRSLSGPVPTWSQTQNFLEWDNGVGGQRRGNPGTNGNNGYTIICSYATYRPPITWTSTETVVTPMPPTAVSFMEPYSWSTEITRQPLADGGIKDPIGEDNLHNQLIDKKTDFGRLWDSINIGSPLSASELTNKVNTALASDANSGHATADLDDRNKKGMAEGGILNVKEQTKYATVLATEAPIVTTVKNCTHTQTWNSYWAGYNSVTSSCSENSTTVPNRTISKSIGTQQNTGFWQMLSVHCNPAEFEELLASDTSLIPIATPDPTNSISGVVRTKNYPVQPSGSQLDFAPTDGPPMKGKPLPHPAKVRTGELGFYDKECPFDCTPDNSSAAGASTANGALSNVVKTPAVMPGTLFGASTEDKTNSNIFEFFRDNAPKAITVNTWYPKSVNGVTYAGEAPVTTTVTRDLAGTPSVDESSGGKFTMKDSKGAAMFTGTSENTAVQKNWDTSTFSSPAATILKGLHNKVSVQSTWASDAGKPQAFNFKWEYAPKVNTTVPLTSIGFGVGSTQTVGATGTVTTPIEGKCYTYFGTSSGSSSVAEFGANTGSGTINTLDAGLLTGPKGDAAKMTTNFVRSTTE